MNPCRNTAKEQYDTDESIPEREQAESLSSLVEKSMGAVIILTRHTFVFSPPVPVYTQQGSTQMSSWFYLSSYLSSQAHKGSLTGTTTVEEST